MFGSYVIRISPKVSYVSVFKRVYFGGPVYFHRLAESQLSWILPKILYYSIDKICWSTCMGLYIAVHLLHWLYLLLCRCHCTPWILTDKSYCDSRRQHRWSCRRKYNLVIRAILQRYEQNYDFYDVRKETRACIYPDLVSIHNYNYDIKLSTVLHIYFFLGYIAACTSTKQDVRNKHASYHSLPPIPQSRGARKSSGPTRLSISLAIQQIIYYLTLN